MAKVLIIEDNEQNRLLVVDVLRYHGFEVIEADNGKKGIEMAKKYKPDLIFMDIQMPVLDGITATKILKTDPETKDIKIIVTTSFAMKKDKEEALNAGCDECLLKPIDTRQLLEVATKLLR